MGGRELTRSLVAVPVVRGSPCGSVSRGCERVLTVLDAVLVEESKFEWAEGKSRRVSLKHSRDLTAVEYQVAKRESDSCAWSVR